MHSTIVLTTALFSTLSFAQSNDFNVNTAEVRSIPSPLLLSSLISPTGNESGC